MNIKPENFASTISKILQEYGDEAREIMETTITSVGKEAAKNVKANAAGFGGTGKYAKGWKAKIEKGRLTVEAHVYNSAQPGLPHLLEFGHAKQNGGRTIAFPHIASVNDWAQQEAVSKLEEKL